MTKSVERYVWLSRYVPLLLWIGVIFFLSSSQGSMSETSRIIRPILEFLFPSAAEDTLIFYHGVIRKLAHFTEYGVLGLLACRAFISAGPDLLRRSPYVFASGLVMVVAILDESSQSFDPTRTGSVWDVVIDISGGLVVIRVIHLFARRRRLGRSTAA